MSYAGTYGPDETCRHDTYWRSCADCSEVGPRATAEQVRKAREQRLAIAAEIKMERQRKAAERSADARLVAAAPDLLAALAKLVDLKDGPRDGTYVAAKHLAWSEARRVLVGLR